MSIQYALVEPARFRLDGGAMFGIIPKPLWNRVAPADSQNRIDLSLRLWVIQSTDRLVVVDTGIGDYHGETFDNRFAVRGGKSPLGEALAELGKSSEQVTDLVLSHLHFDHAGGIGELVEGKMRPVFPHARCHLHEDHYHYALNPTERDAGSFHRQHFAPVLEDYRARGQLIFHRGEEGELLELAPGCLLRFKLSHGHTPYMMHPYDEHYFYLADLVPTSHHLHIPWVMGYDIAPGVTTQDKRRLLSFVREQNLKVVFEHDPQYWGASIDLDAKGRFVAKALYDAQEGLAYSVQ